MNFADESRRWSRVSNILKRILGNRPNESYPKVERDGLSKSVLKNKQSFLSESPIERSSDIPVLEGVNSQPDGGSAGEKCSETISDSVLNEAGLNVNGVQELHQIPSVFELAMMPYDMLTMYFSMQKKVMEVNFERLKTTTAISNATWVHSEMELRKVIAKQEGTIEELKIQLNDLSKNSTYALDSLRAKAKLEEEVVAELRQKMENILATNSKLKQNQESILVENEQLSMQTSLLKENLNEALTQNTFSEQERQQLKRNCSYLNDQLQQSTENSRISIDHANLAIANLSSQLEEAKTNIQKFESSDLNAEISRLSSDLSSVSKALNETKIQLQQSISEKESIQKSEKESRTGLELLVERSRLRYERKIALLEAKLNEMSEFDNTLNELSDAKRVIEVKQNEICKIQLQLEGAKMELFEVQRGENQWRQKALAAESDLEKVESVLLETRLEAEEANLLKSQISKIESELEEVLNELQRTQVETQNLRNSAKVAQEKNVQLQEAFFELERAQEADSWELRTLRKENVNLQSLMEQNRQRNKRIAAKLNLDRLALAADIMQLNVEKSKVNEFYSQNLLTIKAKYQAEEELKSIETDLVQARTEVQRLNSNLFDARNRSIYIKNKLASLAKNASYSKDDIIISEVDEDELVRNIENRLTETESQLKLKITDTERLVRDKNNLILAKDEVDRELSKLTSKLEVIERREMNRQKEAVELQRKLDALRSENSSEQPTFFVKSEKEKVQENILQLNFQKNCEVSKADILPKLEVSPDSDKEDVEVIENLDTSESDNNQLDEELLDKVELENAKKSTSALIHENVEVQPVLDVSIKETRKKDIELHGNQDSNQSKTRNEQQIVVQENEMDKNVDILQNENLAGKLRKANASIESNKKLLLKNNEYNGKLQGSKDTLQHDIESSKENSQKTKENHQLNKSSTGRSSKIKRMVNMIYIEQLKIDEIPVNMRDSKLGSACRVVSVGSKVGGLRSGSLVFFGVDWDKFDGQKEEIDGRKFSLVKASEVKIYKK